MSVRRPHHFRYKQPWFAIDEHHRRQDEPIFQEGRGSVDRIAVHHYVTKCDASDNMHGGSLNFPLPLSELEENSGCDMSLHRELRAHVSYERPQCPEH